MINGMTVGDIFSKKKRSSIMSKISGKDTKPELIVRSYLHGKGFRFLNNDKRYPGKPDIVLPKYGTAIFVHGCFWHGHNCKAGKLPSTRKEFWSNKIGDNVKRDLKNQKELKEMGWNIMVVWQCEIKTIENRETRLPELVSELLRKNKTHVSILS